MYPWPSASGDRSLQIYTIFTDFIFADKGVVVQCSPECTPRDLKLLILKECDGSK